MGAGHTVARSCVSNAEIFRQGPAQPTHPSYALGIMVPGFNAYMGLLDIGQPERRRHISCSSSNRASRATVGYNRKLKVVVIGVGMSRG